LVWPRRASKKKLREAQRRSQQARTFSTYSDRAIKVPLRYPMNDELQDWGYSGKGRSSEHQEYL
jgi:hypothetical protein